MIRHLMLNRDGGQQKEKRLELSSSSISEGRPKEEIWGGKGERYRTIRSEAVGEKGRESHSQLNVTKPKI